MRLNWKPSKVYYGWWIVGACFSVTLLTGGIIVYGFTAVFEPIANEFGWSYTQISLAASLRGLEVGLLAPLTGMLTDRWGPRRLIFGGVVISGLGLMLLSQTTSLSMFYGAFILLAIGLSTCSSAVVITTVANWFHRKISIATGITTCGWGFSGFLVPVIVRLVDLYEWRTTMVILALSMLVIGIPLSLLVRHKPEQYGYLPDGEVYSTAIPDKGLAPAQTTERNIGAKQALKSQAFWHMSLPIMAQYIAISAVVTHVMPYLSSIGITRSVSSLVASGIPLLSIGGRLGFGWLGDKLDKRRVLAGAFAMMSLGLLCFEYVSSESTWLLVLFLILFGIGFGGNIPVRASLLREFFGRSNFGTILGFLIGMQALGSAAGPPLVGWVFDTWGSYQNIWLAFASLAIMTSIAVATTPPASTITQAIDKAS